MDIFSGLNDFTTTQDGDLVISNGDISKSSGLDWFIQEVNKIIKSDKDDWLFAPDEGASVSDFYGATNSRETGKKLENRLVARITNQNIQFPAKLDVQVVPVSVDAIRVYINLKYGSEVIPVTRLVLDLQNGFIKMLDTKEEVKGKQANNKNPYLYRVS